MFSKVRECFTITNLLAGLVIVFTCSSVFAAPETWIQSVTYNGETITMQLIKENLRGDNFELWVQNSSGGYDVETANVVGERSYIGTVDEYPGAISCGVLADNGLFRGAVYFDRGESWFTIDNAVVSTRALGYADFSSFHIPSSHAVRPGQAGSTMYGFDVGVDVDYNYFSGAGRNDVAKTFEHIEYSVCLVRAIYIRDVLLQSYLGRVIIRASLPHDPYTGLTQGTYLDKVRTEWNTNHTDAERDVVAGVSPVKIGGGLAWVGVIGTSSAYSVSQSGGSDGRFDVVWRHEMGHNWGCNHFEGGSPEGAGLMGGNAPGRFSSCEIYKVLSHRNGRLNIFDNLGTYTAIPLPPYAGLDVGVFKQTVTTSLVLDVMANDFDGNGESISIDSFESISLNGGTVIQQGDDLVYNPGGNYLGLDNFKYTIIDSYGQTATGVVLVDVQPNDPMRLYLPLDETSGTVAQDQSIFKHDGVASGDLDFGVDSVAGRFDSGIGLDGVDDHIAINDLNISSKNVTISGWVKLPADPSGWSAILFNRDTGAAGLSFGAATELRYHWNNNHWSWSSGLNVPLNKWTFVSLVVEPTKAAIYMYYDGMNPSNDGKPRSAVNYGIHNLEAFNGTTYVGYDPSSEVRHLKGFVDEVRIYNYAMTYAEIKSLIAGGRAESPDPFDGSSNLILETGLSWSMSPSAIANDIYIGTDHAAVEIASLESPEYITTQTENVYLQMFAPMTEYFWRIDQVDASGNVTIGKVWSFTTGNGTGTISRQVWQNISGAYVYDLKDNAAYPDNPTFSEAISSFEGPVNWANNYATKIHGFIIPEATGSYTFWIASDARSELWLSSDAAPANITKIAKISGIMAAWTNPRQWDKYPSQKSSAVKLIKGRPYYIMALHKAGSGNDNIAVAWQGPGISQQVISGKYLMPYIEGFQWVPEFSADPIIAPDAIEGIAYDYSIAGIAEAFDGGAVTYNKIGGPEWLSVAADGTLGGVARDDDAAAINQFTVKANDSNGNSSNAELQIFVHDTFTGELGVVDFNGLSESWLSSGCLDMPKCQGSDLNGDGNVGIQDLLVFCDFWLINGASL